MSGTETHYITKNVKDIFDKTERNEIIFMQKIKPVPVLNTVYLKILPPRGYYFFSN